MHDSTQSAGGKLMVSPSMMLHITGERDDSKEVLSGATEGFLLYLHPVLK